MFYLILRLLHEEMTQDKISREEYFSAVVKIAHFHGTKRNGII
jgi:hypothetical protein